MNEQKTFVFKRPHDNSPGTFYTYVDKDVNVNGDERLWLDIAPNGKCCLRSVMYNIVKRPELNLVKKAHFFTHGNKHDLVRLFTKAGMMNQKVKKEIEKVTSSCISCARSGRPTNANQLSLKHVNKECNDEVQADFLTVKYREGKVEVLNIVDAGTGYGEGQL